MKIGIMTVLYDQLRLEKVLQYVSDLGFEAVEIAAWRGAHHIDIDKVLSGGATEYKKIIENHGLTISALSNHLESQLVLGPHDKSTDIWFKGTRASFHCDH